ncbi:unnamed protein product [Bemisia tabaci]|uniref:F-box domain-containing protein n=1 Tax=Bemisia tabaci TaxID=7038 RepID=A0A9P0ACQ9_BEMTA|nr:unnamed protein product [Bemisia tabaci]
MSEITWNNLPSVILYEVFSYLPRKDILNASSSCKLWRIGLHHPKLGKKINFKISSNNSQSFLRTQFLTDLYGHRVKAVTITFDSIDTPSVEMMETVLRALSSNANLQEINFESSYCSLACPGTDCESGIPVLEKKIIKNVQEIITNSRALNVLNFGCNEDLTLHIGSFLELLIKFQAESISTLGLASVKEDFNDYVLPELDVTHFASFPNLQVLSVDYDYMCDELLGSLNKTTGLQRLIIHVHGIEENHPGTSNRAWETFTQQNSKCELSLNLIHAYDAVEVLHNGFLQPAMPLTHLRVFFCEQLNAPAIHQLSRFSNTLRTLWWVDSFNSSHADVLIEPNDLDEQPELGVNPFIIAAWRCSKLTELVVHGYKMLAEDVVAISRLRQSLKVFKLPESDIVFFPMNRVPLQEVEKEVTQNIGHSWSATPDSELHSVILNPTGGESDEFIIPIVSQDLQI